jgi:hypothetical protein
MVKDPCAYCGGTGAIRCNHCGGTGINENSSLLMTLSGSYHYRVDSTKVVKPEETEVLEDGDDDILTLVTC